MSVVWISTHTLLSLYLEGLFLAKVINIKEVGITCSPLFKEVQSPSFNRNITSIRQSPVQLVQWESIRRTSQLSFLFQSLCWFHYNWSKRKGKGIIRRTGTSHSNVSPKRTVISQYYSPALLFLSEALKMHIILWLKATWSTHHVHLNTQHAVLLDNNWKLTT